LCCLYLVGTGGCNHGDRMATVAGYVKQSAQVLCCASNLPECNHLLSLSPPGRPHATPETKARGFGSGNVGGLGADRSLIWARSRGPVRCGATPAKGANCYQPSEANSRSHISETDCARLANRTLVRGWRGCFGECRLPVSGAPPRGARRSPSARANRRLTRHSQSEPCRAEDRVGRSWPAIQLSAVTFSDG
jgi:hypothetical protein